MNDFATSISETFDDGLILAGYTLSNDDDVSGSYGGADAWIIKLGKGGKKQWQKCSKALLLPAAIFYPAKINLFQTSSELILFAFLNGGRISYY